MTHAYLDYIYELNHQNKMAEPPQKKLRYSVAEQTVDHINGRSLGQLLDEERFWIMRRTTFENTPTKELIALRKLSKTKQQQIDRYLRTVRYKNWDLPADQKDFIFLIILYDFFDFDPRYSIELQRDNKFERIFLFYARRKSDISIDNRYLFGTISIDDNSLDARVYLVIPLGVEQIEEGAFFPGFGFNTESCITKVWTPPSLKYIRNNAFNNCENLTKIKIPHRLEEIGGFAFTYCKNLKDLTFPSSLRYLGQSCFLNAGLESVKFRDSQIRDQILHIDIAAFFGCSKLKDLILPSHEIIIWDKAFEGTGLVDIVIPYNVVQLHKNCFARCKKLRTVDIQANIDMISDRSFFECEQLHTVSLPQSVDTIGENAFSKTALKSIDLGPIILGIQQEAFSFTKLTRIHFSKNLLYIDFYAFQNSELKHVSFSPEINVDNTEFVIADGAFENTPIEIVECSYKLFQKCKRSFSETTTEQIRFHFYGEKPDLILNKSSLQEPSQGSPQNVV